ncbi:MULTISPECIES: hypothetical protein, partial [unclassified Microcoleus]|uniref:hypothetical protein n=1 Tax=unclassified Microcoleus TaxID=2642155 RepID=UPI002FD280C3
DDISHSVIPAHSDDISHSVIPAHSDDISHSVIPAHSDTDTISLTPAHSLTLTTPSPDRKPVADRTWRHCDCKCWQCDRYRGFG